MSKSDKNGIEISPVHLVQQRLLILPQNR